MKTRMTMVYWKGQKYWVGKLLEHTEIDEALAKHIRKYLGLK